MAFQIGARKPKIRVIYMEGSITDGAGTPAEYRWIRDALIEDPNSRIHEAKAFTCQIAAGMVRAIEPRPTVPFAPWPTRDPMPGTRPGAQPEGQFR